MAKKKNVPDLTKPEVTSPHDPGTPDDDVPQERLLGRRAYRAGFSVDRNPYPHAGRTGWYLGWYDERLRRFYGR